MSGRLRGMWRGVSGFGRGEVVWVWGICGDWPEVCDGSLDRAGGGIRDSISGHPVLSGTPEVEEDACTLLRSREIHRPEILLSKQTRTRPSPAVEKAERHWENNGLEFCAEQAKVGFLGCVGVPLVEMSIGPRQIRGLDLLASWMEGSFHPRRFDMLADRRGCAGVSRTC
jgi:hypothetical protein